MLITHLDQVFNELVSVEQVLRPFNVILVLVSQEHTLDIRIHSQFQILLLVSVYLDSSDRILYKLEAFIVIFESIEISPVSSGLEAIFSELVRLDLLSQLCLDLQIDLHCVHFIFWTHI
jgi:hypothetical protein